MGQTKCSSKNPATCRYHGHDEQVSIVKDQQRQAEEKRDFEGYFNATKTLEALEKRKAIVDGLESSLEEARASGDFKRFFDLTESFEEVTGVNYEKEVGKVEAPAEPKPRLQDLVGSDGETYVSADSVEVDYGTYTPDHIHSIDPYDGSTVAFVKASAYSYHNYPDVMRIQASRPLSDEEVQKVAQLTGYQHRSTLNGEGLSDPERSGRASVVVGTDNTKSYGRQNHFEDFEDGLQATIQEGSPVRKTNRSGEGTKGTRLIDGIGKDVTFTLYYQDSSVKFPKN